MNKLTPKDVLSNSLQEGDFRRIEAERHNIDKGLTRPFKKIDIEKFGEIFLKCIGQINSIVKRGVAEPRSPQRVIKHRIGYRPSRSEGNQLPRGNSRYATQMQTFAVLHSEHVNLACKRAKREMISDFYKVKEDMLIKFQNMKAIALEHVDDYITIASAYEVAYKNITSGRSSFNVIGHMLMNSRAISRDDVYVTIEDNDKLLGSYEESLSNFSYIYYGKAQDSNLVFKVFIRERLSENDSNGEPMYDETVLFKCEVYSRSYHNGAPRLTYFNTRFDGIDINGMANALADEYDSFYNEFETSLEAVKQKYHGEYLLHEICESDGAI